MDGRRPSRKIFTKPMLWRRTRRHCHHFSTISAQEMIEKSSRMPSTTLATGPADQRISSIPVFKESEVGKRAPLMYSESTASDYTKQIADLSNFCSDFCGLSRGITE